MIVSESIYMIENLLYYKFSG